jgi:hypothetical protein
MAEAIADHADHADHAVPVGSGTVATTIACGI